MSISLNDHEDRIKSLEDRFKTQIVRQDILFSGKSNKDSITLSKSVYNYDAVVVHYDEGIAGETKFIPKILYNTELTGEFSTNRTQSIVKVVDDKFVFVDNWYNAKPNYLKYVVGLKWGGGINLGILLKRFIVYIKTYSKLFHLQFLEVK